MDEEYQPMRIMEKLFKANHENRVCVECKSPMPSFVSINNAILLCDACAERHMKLGYNISYVRHLAEDWDAYLFAYLERGGNARFISLSKNYELDEAIKYSNLADSISVTIVGTISSYPKLEDIKNAFTY